MDTDSPVCSPMFWVMRVINGDSLVFLARLSYHHVKLNGLQHFVRARSHVVASSADNVTLSFPDSIKLRSLHLALRTTVPSNVAYLAILVTGTILFPFFLLLILPWARLSSTSLRSGEIHLVVSVVVLNLGCSVVSVISTRVEIVALLLSSLVELVVDIDSRPDQRFQVIGRSTRAHEFVLDIFLEAAPEHGHKSLLVPSRDLGVFLELDRVLRGCSSLSEVLDDSDCRVLIVGDSENKT